MAARVAEAVLPAGRLAGLLLLAACSSNVLSGRPAVQAPPQPAPVQPTPIPEPMPAPAQEAKVKVALLLPLSGQAANVGNTLLNAAQLALFDRNDSRMLLLPRDTRGNPQGAVEAARGAVADGAQIILGPLYSAEVAAVRPVVQPTGVPVLAFTNDQAQAGGGTYVMGFTPGDDVRRVVGFARAQGHTRLAALAPKSALGDLVVDSLYRTAQQLGAQITWVERFDPTASFDPATPVRNLAARKGFQGLLVAAGGDQLRALAGNLPANGIEPPAVRLLGTGLWDDPTLGRNPALRGGWFAATPPQVRTDFEARYTALYGGQPLRIATLAYDATALASALAPGTVPGQPFDSASLTNPSGFAGLDGVFRLRPNGQVERGLAVLEVTAEGYRVVDPAPTSFETLTQ